ncbi:unnamed protein product [Ranitomeya imitator]|uniref:DNA replication complex GINS protein PSF3 n=1 Tax=Ranitomeya imitator TaxID=111125 RepID=A0ABN9LMP7_9NEOB|nr:unnamed protein product [Ranitomeya imitator]
MELPLWMVKGLYDNKRRIVSVELPRTYREGWRTPCSALTPGWWTCTRWDLTTTAFGLQLLSFQSPENTEIAQTLLQTFIGRFRRIMDSSQNAYNEDTSALVARLDELERGLFRTGQKGLNAFQSWERGTATRITASSLVQSYKKRSSMRQTPDSAVVRVLLVSGCGGLAGAATSALLSSWKLRPCLVYGSTDP